MESWNFFLEFVDFPHVFKITMVFLCVENASYNIVQEKFQFCQTVHVGKGRELIFNIQIYSTCIY